MDKPKKKLNWQLLFYVLLCINVAVILSVFLLVFLPITPNQTLPEKEYIEEEEGAEFTVYSSKNNLSELVNGYVDKLLKDEGDKYSVQFNDDVLINGYIEAFQTEIPITIRLEPIVQENGDVILQQNQISLGLLDLPNRKVLEYLEDKIPTPDWVIFNPKEENIYIAVTQMDIKSNFKVKVQQIDLVNDQISFRIKVPNETLGL